MQSSAIRTPPLAGLDRRTHLEDAAQTAPDAAEKIMPALDHRKGGNGTELHPTAMPNHAEQAAHATG